jgi:hypothetical protein
MHNKNNNWRHKKARETLHYSLLEQSPKTVLCRASPSSIYQNLKKNIKLIFISLNFTFYTNQPRQYEVRKYFIYKYKIIFLHRKR